MTTTIDLHSTSLGFHRGFAKRTGERQIDWLVSSRADLGTALALPTLHRKLFVAAVLADEREVAQAWLAALAMSTAAACSIARNAGGTAVVTLQPGSDPVTFAVPATLPAPVSPLLWEEGFWAAYLSNHPTAGQSLARICALTPAQLAAVSPGPAPHPADLARMEAWRGLVVDDVDLVEAFLAALDAHGTPELTAAYKADEPYANWLFLVRGAELDAIGAMRERDQARFDKTFLSAVTEHRDFWKVGGAFPDYNPAYDGEHRAIYDRGLVSLSLLGLTRRARKVGLTVNVESPYIPSWLQAT